MANENVKIIIQEDNQTQPQGSGTSSDVAYIPGMACTYISHFDANGNVVETEYTLDTIGAKTQEEAEKLGYQLQSGRYDKDGKEIYYKLTKANTPVLCNTVAEFESYFGSVPYRMTQSDVTLCTKYPHKYLENDFDKSYIYAKELLSQGLYIIYENIIPQNGLQSAAVVSYAGDSTISSLVDKGDGTFVYTVDNSTNDPQVFDFLFSLVSQPAGAGEVTVLIDNLGQAEDYDFTTTVTSSKPKFTVTQDLTTPTKYVISLPASTTKNDLNTTLFSVSVSTKYKGKTTTKSTIQNSFRISVVEGTTHYDSMSSANMVGSRIDHLYGQLSSSLERISDKSEYSVKYITSGGYPTFIDVTNEDNGTVSKPLVTTMLKWAAERGDAVALIDHLADRTKPLRHTNEASVYNELQSMISGLENGTYGTMFTPWALYNCPTMLVPTYMSQFLPASFAYLMCLARAIKTSPNWLAMAGVTRGAVPNINYLDTAEILTNVIAEDYQPKYGQDGNTASINAITNIKPYGLTIWGNRTLEPVDPKGTTALNFLNTRNMISDIKKLSYDVARKLMFEQDSDALWLRFKSGISPLLDQLKSGYGIADYKLIKGTTKYNGKALTKGELAAVIKIYPLYAVEYFEITVVMADQEISVS